MENLQAVNDMIPLTVDSLYCQPRVALFSPGNNEVMNSASNNIYYVVLVDLPNISQYPAPNSTYNNPVIQADGSIFFPYTLADGSELPDVPPPGIPMATYCLPVYGCNPVTTEDDEFIYYPSVYFGKVDNKHKGIGKKTKGTELPASPYYQVYKCLPMVIKSATIPYQVFVGCLVFLNDADICNGWGTGGTIVTLQVQQANPPAQYNSSFQGFSAGVLQSTTVNGFTEVSVIFLPSYFPSGQPPAHFSYAAADMVVL